MMCDATSTQSEVSRETMIWKASHLHLCTQTLVAASVLCLAGMLCLQLEENRWSLSGQRIAAALPEKSSKSPDTLHFCRLPKLNLPEGGGLPTACQCQGFACKNFTDRMMQHVQNASSPTWGRQHFPVPKGKSILVIGNSHTRQTLRALLCQHQKEIEKSMMHGQERVIFETMQLSWALRMHLSSTHTIGSTRSRKSLD